MLLFLKKLFPVLIVAAVLVGAFGAGFRCASTEIRKSSLDKCLDAVRGQGWFTREAVKDSAVIEKCERYHREEIIRDFGANIENSAKLNYIESGSVYGMATGKK